MGGAVIGQAAHLGRTLLGLQRSQYTNLLPSGTGCGAVSTDIHTGAGAAEPSANGGERRNYRLRSSGLRYSSKDSMSVRAEVRGWH